MESLKSSWHLLETLMNILLKDSFSTIANVFSVFLLFHSVKHRCQIALPRKEEPGLEHANKLSLDLKSPSCWWRLH